MKCENCGHENISLSQRVVRKRKELILSLIKAAETIHLQRLFVRSRIRGYRAGRKTFDRDIKRLTADDKIILSYEERSGRARILVERKIRNDRR